MAEAIGALRAELSATAAQFEKDMGRAAKALGLTRQSFQALQAAAQLASVAVAATVATFAAIVKSTANAGDEISNLSRRVGMTAEDFAALRDALAISEVDADAFQTAMRTLAKHMSDAADGSKEAQKTFAELGVSVKSADGSLRPLKDVTLEIADRFATMSDQTKRAALSQEAFGRGGLAMINGLEAGSKAIREQMEESKALGRVWDDDSAKAAEAFNDNLTRLGWALDGIKIAIGKALIPTLNDLAGRLVALAKSDAFREWVERVAMGCRELVEVLMDYLPTALKYSMAAFRAAATGVLALASGVMTLEMSYRGLQLAVNQAALTLYETFGITSALGVPIEEVRREIDALTARIGVLRDNIEMTGKGMHALAFGDFPTLPAAAVPPPGPPPKATRPFTPVTPEKAKKDEKDPYYEAYKAQQAIIEEAQKLGNEFIADEQERFAKRIAELEKMYAIEKEMGEKFLADQNAGIAAAYKEQLELTKQLSADEIKAWVARIEQMEALDYQAAMAEVERLQRIATQTRAAIETAIGGLFSPISRAFSGMVMGVLQGTQTLEEGFKRMGQNIAASLMEMVVEKGLRKIADALTDFAMSLSRSGGEWGGIIAAVANAFAGARAGGGPVFAGGSYLVGERGPELFVPGAAGRIVPNEELGGGTTVYVDARGAQRGVSAEVMQAIRIGMGQAVNISLARVQDARRRGGMKAFG